MKHQNQIPSVSLQPLITPLQTDEKGKMTGGFSTALTTESSIFQNQQEDTESNLCVNIKCNVVAGCGVKQ